MKRRPYEELAAQLAQADELAAALHLQNEGLRRQLAIAQRELAAANAALLSARADIEALEVCNESMRRAVNDAGRLEGTALDRAVLGASIGALADGARRLAESQALDVEDPT